MPTRPLLRLPHPDPVGLPPGHGRAGAIRLPSRGRQGDRFSPVFNRLRAALGRANGPIELRDDPSRLAPERVIVFEIAGTVANFLKAVGRIRGLEFMAEYDEEFAADQDFALQDGREGRRGQDRTDKPVPGRFYLAMPDMQALRELLSLWDRWLRGEPMERGFAPFAHLFAQLRDVRPWGPQDRIPDETVAFWREQSNQYPGQPVRTEVELWYRENGNTRAAASLNLVAMVTAAGGDVVHEAVIPDIAYHGALVDIPAAEVANLMEHRAVSLALADDIMFLRPQSMLRGPLQEEPQADPAAAGLAAALPAGSPIAALLDGVPVQAHLLLTNRLVLDDPHNLQARALVARRVHGTAMASLILHGDRNEDGSSLSRPLYVRPVMIANANGQEHTEADRLLIDTLYRAVLRIKGSEGQEAVASYGAKIGSEEKRKPEPRQRSCASTPPGRNDEQSGGRRMRQPPAIPF